MIAIRQRLCTSLVGLLWVGMAAQAAQIDGVTAANLMAAYLRHIAALTSWPDDDPAEPIRIGVVGRDPNGVMDPIRIRTESADGLTAQERPIMLVELGNEVGPPELASCALLFLSEGAEQDWQRLRPMVGKLPIMTVSEMEGFTDLGGMIEYFVDRRSGKVLMKVNLPAVRAAGISLSARFLALKSVIVLGEQEAQR
ncbi:MAG: YfiR family protein [Gammaproteobacteria bacterium]|jgi:hypothetical protein